MTAQTETILDGTPSVWIACLASYNEGTLHGKWVHVPDTAEGLQEEIDKVIKSSRAYGAEEWAFHDNSDFGPFDIGEWEDMESLVMKANILNNLESWESEGFDHWNYEEHTGDDEDTILERFREQYVGSFESTEDFAYDDMHEMHSIPEHLENYIDYKSYWRDLECSGYYSVDVGFKNTHIFHPS